MITQTILTIDENNPDEEVLFEKLIQAWAWRNTPEMQDVDQRHRCFQVVYNGNLYTIAVGTL